MEKQHPLTVGIGCALKPTKPSARGRQAACRVFRSNRSVAMRMFACAVVLTLAVVGVAVGDDFFVTITKVDATKGTIEYKKYSGEDKDSKLEDKVYKAHLAKGAKIIKSDLDVDL